MQTSTIAFAKAKALPKDVSPRDKVESRQFRIVGYLVISNDEHLFFAASTSGGLGNVLISIRTFPPRLKPHWWEGAYGTDESVPFQSRTKLGHYPRLSNSGEQQNRCRMPLFSKLRMKFWLAKWEVS